MLEQYLKLVQDRSHPRLVHSTKWYAHLLWRFRTAVVLKQSTNQPKTFRSGNERVWLLQLSFGNSYIRKCKVYVFQNNLNYMKVTDMVF
jgi:hypothetical protein